MKNYKVRFNKSSEKELGKIAKKNRQVAIKIKDAIGDLRENPRPAGCEKLTDQSLYRVRVGDYRIVYDVDDEIVTVLVLKIGDRKEIYRMLKR